MLKYQLQLSYIKKNVGAFESIHYNDPPVYLMLRVRTVRIVHVALKAAQCIRDTAMEYCMTLASYPRKTQRHRVRVHRGRSPNYRKYSCLAKASHTSPHSRLTQWARSGSSEMERWA